MERVVHCLDRAHDTGFRAKAFVRALGFAGDPVVKTAMVPQIQVEFADEPAVDLQIPQFRCRTQLSFEMLAAARGDVIRDRRRQQRVEPPAVAARGTTREATMARPRPTAS